MKYILDTNILVDGLRGKKIVDYSLIQEGSGISIITVAELYYGAQKSAHPEKNLQAVDNLIKDFKLRILELHVESMLTFAKQKAALEKKGTRIEDFDLLIAATAITNDLILVTRNRKHFERIERLRLFE